MFALGPLRPLRGSRAPSCDFASQSSSLRSSGDLTASPQVHLALGQPDACRRGRMARDHEPCERRVALWQHSAVSPRHGLRRCLASRATTAAPAGAPSAGHEHGPKARHEMKKSFLWLQLIDATDFVSFRAPRRWLSCRGHLTQTEGRDGAGTPREGRCYRKGKETSENC